MSIGDWPIEYGHRAESVATDLVLVPCARCGAEKGERCKRLGSQMARFRYVDHFHAARWEAFRDATCEELCMDECYGNCGV